jgi:hypothetical protein
MVLNASTNVSNNAIVTLDTVGLGNAMERSPDGGLLSALAQPAELYAATQRSYQLASSSENEFAISRDRQFNSYRQISD